MGVDFARRAAPTFEKCWDTGLVKLETANLFTQAPVCSARHITADITYSVELKVGDCLTVVPEGDALVARLGLTIVGRVTKPVSEILEAVRNSCGVAMGRVEQVHMFSKRVDLSLC